MDFILDVIINFVAFANFMFPSAKLKGREQYIEKSIAVLGLIGMSMVGIGFLISGTDKVHEYMYVILLAELCILLANIVTNNLIRWRSTSRLKNICILVLILTNMLIYISYIVLTFII
ncbi:hypothetical protein [Listeria fleischmannii]|nr:hypothetical protein [Listeria fleischmannii]EMG27365.1 hypothetical protein LFLEISCH_11420 [Listeria fleischmannii subsp. fleischmannii LU2006-1]